MKNYKSIAGAVFLFVTLALCLIQLNYILRPTYTDECYSQIETFHSLPDNSLEVIVYGSSHAYVGLAPMEMYKNYGIGAYNYGYSWQKINTTKLFIKDSLNNQCPKIALIEAYVADTVLEDTDMCAEVYYSRYIKDKEARKEYLKQCLGDGPSLVRRASYIFPFCMFHENWKEFDGSGFKPLPTDNKLRKTMGFYESDVVMPVDIPDYNPDNQEEFTEESLKELKDIVDICQSKGITVVFYTAPFAVEYKYKDAMEKFAEENGCDFIDLNGHLDEVGIDENTDFRDIDHVNTTGAIKVSNYLAKYLTEHYDLTDMRTVENNLWEISANLE